MIELFFGEIKATGFLLQISRNQNVIYNLMDRRPTAINSNSSPTTCLRYLSSWDLFSSVEPHRASQVALEGKNLAANAGDRRDRVPSLGREDPLEEGTGNPLQCSCLEHPTDRRA